MRTDSDEEVLRSIAVLGHELSLGVDAVIADLHRRTQLSGHVLEEDVENLFLAAGRRSTEAFAVWMISGNPEIARREGLKASQIFGELAARNDAPLNEATKRCMRWYDAVASYLQPVAIELDLNRCLPEAVAMLDRSLKVTIVRMTESFEIERQRMHESLMAQQARVAFQANHDALTGLPDRSLIMDRIEQLLLRHPRFGTEATVLFLDLDNFKAINDNFGHSVGDHLLQAVGERLGGVLRESDTLGRLGGDEFIVVADCVPPREAPELICHRLLTALEVPFNLNVSGFSPLRMTASIGVATGTHLPAEDILRHADIAMYRAKRDGKNRCVCFEEEMLKSVATSFELDTDLQRALQDGEFKLLYQPVIDLTSMAVVGVEALLRWRHPTRGLLGPSEFISHLEESGLIAAVGKWVLDEATGQATSWLESGRRLHLEMGVNLSRRELDSDDVVARIASALDQSGLNPNDLCIEVTETGVMSNLESALSRLEAIRDLGVRIAIDDFGTGHSSLSHLQQFPVDLLKIDQSFIRRLFLERSGGMLVRAQIQLAHALEIETQAKGVEDGAQLAFLRQERCGRAQGFHISHPLEPSAIEEFIARWPGQSFENALQSPTY
jgi:diguanylate cyclase (GGDEF)-like protein